MAAVGVRSYGAEALQVEVDSTAAATALPEQFASLPGVVEAMPGLMSVLVRFDPTRVDAVSLAGSLVERASQLSPVDATAAGDAVVVHVVYDGEDLADVARFTGLDVDDVVARHLAATYRVALIGMAPGFYFLAGGDERLQVPRRTSPREAVPRGAVGLAGAYTGIYPKRGPGGWQLIGRVVDELWHPDRHPAARLAPGTVVRFEAA